MKIRSITIRNIKGIADKTIILDAFPNKPHLIVAPNGYGKSSIAAAFDSMNSKRLLLDPSNLHKGDETLSSELIVEVVDDAGKSEQLKVNATSNSLSQSFDVCVIGSRVSPKSVKRNFGKFTQASASLEVKPIALWKIPSKIDFNYSYSDQRVAFGANGKILPNIGDLLDRPAVIAAVMKSDMSRLCGKRVSGAIADAISTINNQKGTADQICQWIATNHIDALKAIAPLDVLAQGLLNIEQSSLSSEVEAFLGAIQIASLYRADDKRFDAAATYVQYTGERDRCQRLCEGLYGGWAEVTISEEKKLGRLVVTFPKANQFSNGQRDILSCVFMLEKARHELTKQNAILIIDEVFDYLDDGNLIAFQYFITRFIESFKRQGRELFPILLTHLDPAIFNHFCFGGHKVHVHYLDAKPSPKSENTTRLVQARGPIATTLDLHYFHYHPTPLSHAGQFAAMNLPTEWEDPLEFRKYVESERQRYLANKNFDPLGVCFAVRLAIEEAIYKMFTEQAHRSQFIATNGTTNKLDYAASVGVDVQESFFLLGLIYNDGLHAKGNRDMSGVIGTKLRHPVIKRLISRI